LSRPIYCVSEDTDDPENPEPEPKVYEEGQRELFEEAHFLGHLWGDETFFPQASQRTIAPTRMKYSSSESLPAEVVTEKGLPERYWVIRNPREQE
jgi:hypothetical protein